MGTREGVAPDPALRLLELYDEALPHVYGYLLARCRDVPLAEDLTADPAARRPYGLLVECVDDQGAHFQLWQPVD
jgi:hypothetical protein